MNVLIGGKKMTRWLDQKRKEDEQIKKVGRTIVT